MSDNFFLSKPDCKYKKSFFEAISDYKNSNSIHIFSVVNCFNLTDDKFEQMLQIVKNISLGIGLPKGHVSSSQYWLIKNKKYVGTVDIRHNLSPYLEIAGGHIGYEIAVSERGKGYSKIALRLALKKAKELGIEKAMVMCEETNVRSKRCIESIMREVGGEIISSSEVDGKCNLRYVLETG